MPHQIRACAFDAYGTLFDVHSAVKKSGQALADQAGPVSALWRQKQLEYTWLRSLSGRHADFWQVTSEALDYALTSRGIQNPALHQALMQAYLELDAYPEVPGVLQRLKEAGIPAVILSNGSPAMLEAAVKHSGLEGFFQKLISVEEVKVFKTDPRVYGLAEKHLGLPPGQVAFLSSNAWDVAGAASFGLRVIWVNRFGQTPERLPGQAEHEITSLEQLPSLLGVA